MTTTYVSIAKDVYNVALNRLMGAEMPRVRYRLGDSLGMADDAVMALRQEMNEIACLLQSGNKDVQ